MEPSLRTFIAVELNNEIRDLIHQLQNDLRKTTADIKWVLPDNCHITLKFLGDISPEQAASVKNILEECAAASQPFSLILENVGAFPTVKQPEIIWIGIKNSHDQLSELAAALEERLLRIDFPKENRPFNAHITIGRVKSKRSTQLIADQLAGASFTAQIIEVSRLTLFQSQLSPDGPIYTALHRSPLK